MDPASEFPPPSRRSHNLAFLAGLALLVLTVLVLRSWRKAPPPGPGDGVSSKAAHPEQPFQPVPAAPEHARDGGVLGALRVSEDAAAKTGGFWLEQFLELPAPLPEGPLADVYLTIQPEHARGMRLRITAKEMRLERVLQAKDAPEGKPTVELLASAPIPDPEGLLVVARPKPRVGALWRGGELSAWWDARLLFTYRGALDLTGPSGAATSCQGVVLGPRRAVPLEPVAFRDTFMRAAAGQAWKPARGKWELTALAFPERSANPFSLRASFGDDPPAYERLYQDRLRQGHTGLGVMFSNMEGTLHVQRITGGSPAARAGLQEDDTVVEVDGQPADQMSPWHAQRLMAEGASLGGPAVRIKVLRPGEKTLREFSIPREEYRWGTPMEAQLIKPVTETDEALILAGEPGWSDYAAEVAAKPLGAGGFGLAIAALAPEDCLLLRWLGPAPHTATPGRSPDQVSEELAREKLQLVRVEHGRQTVLAERAARYRPYEFYRLGLDWRGEDVTARVDGVAVFSARAPGLRRGQVGLYARRGDPVYFDDVSVASDRAALAGSTRPERKVNAVFSAEQDMERWANPALEWRRDGVSPWAVHTALFPGEQAVALHKPRFDDLEIRLRCGQDPASGTGAPTLRVRAGKAWLEAAGGTPFGAPREVGAGPFERVAFRAGPGGLQADVDGVRLEAGAGAGAAAAGPGERIAIRGLRNLGDPATLRAAATGVLEYTFDGAPSDWKVASGRWGLLNKWICDPRWSWFGGRSECVAAIWNKKVFHGDMTLDAYVAQMMQRDDPPYERAGDFNLVLCGDGVNLDSGYALICGGGQNFWTRLYRKGVAVAEATEERFRLPGDRVRQPDKPELHQRWFHLRLEKTGNRLAFYRDGERAFEWTDPEPLEGGRAALWTMDNGMLVSRCRIAFERCEEGPLESRASALFDDGKVINLFDGEAHTRVEPEKLPAEIAASLASAPARFKPAAAARAATPGAGPVEEAGWGWRVVNGAGGGPMALQWKRLLIDPALMGIARFAVRIEPGTAVDLCLMDPHTREAFRWRLSGPAHSHEAAPLVGRVEGVQADGRWHSVQCDLSASWNAFWRRRSSARPPRAALRPLIGCVDQEDYLLAGFGGNRAGAEYAVSDLSFLKPEDVDFASPEAAQVIWPYDGAGDGASVKVVFNDPGGSGVEPATMRLTLAGQVVPARLVEFDEETQTAQVDLRPFRPETGWSEGQKIELVISPFADRAGNLSKGSAAVWTFSLAQAAAARKPATAPSITAVLDAPEPPIGLAGPPSGPMSLNDIAPMASDRDVFFQASDDRPPDGPNAKSLRVCAARDGSAFGFRLKNVWYDLARWPYLAMTYRIPHEVPVNLHFQSRQGRMFALTLTDVGDREDGFSGGEMWGRGMAYLGPPAGFVDDGSWRRVEVPLLRLAAEQRSWEADWTVGQFDFHDNGWHGSRRGMAYLIHDLRALPASRSRGIAFTWSSKDLCGTKEYASALDANPATEPEGQAIRPLLSMEGAARQARLEAGAPPADDVPLIPDGWRYLHLRLKNGAGVWSPTVHYPVRIDNSAPKVLRSEPPDGGTLAGKTVRIFFAEDHVIVPGSMRLSVGGEALTDGQPGLSYDPATQVLTYDGARAGRTWEHGASVRVALSGAADSLGNAMRQPHVFSFVVDATKDRAGPAITKVRFMPAHGLAESMPRRPLLLELSMALDFEETLGHVRALRDVRLDWTGDPTTAAFGRRATRFTCLEDGGDVQVMLHKNAWHMDQYPLILFDYKADPGMPVDLQVLVLGEWHTVRFLGGEGGGGAGRSIGAVPAAQADGHWRQAAADLRALIDRAIPNLPVRIISQVILSAHGQAGCRRGAALWLDNLSLCQDAGQGGVLQWEVAPDPSGIEGYAVAVDQEPGTEPPPHITDVTPLRREGGRTGTWFVHIRAKDQAGNWGPTRHYRMDF